MLYSNFKCVLSNKSFSKFIVGTLEAFLQQPTAQLLISWSQFSQCFHFPLQLLFPRGPIFENLLTRV